MKIIVYELTDETAEWQAYYATLKEAREGAALCGSDETSIDRLTLVDLPPKKLAAKLLNGRGFVTKREKL